VLGANLGTALNPLLQARGGPGCAPRLRLPVGNLLNRVVGCAVALALLPGFTALVAALDPSPVRLVANAHLAFNLATALVALPLLRPQAWLLTRLLPPPLPESDPSAPRYLDLSALDTPSVALANATREALRVADALKDMLEASARSFTTEDRSAGKSVARMDDTVDSLHRAVHAYLAALRAETLSDEEARRTRRIQDFVIALEQAADVLARDLAQHAAKRLRRGLNVTAAGQAMLDGVHAALAGQLSLAVTVFLSDDLDAARRIVAAKEALRGTEREAARRVVAAGAAPASEGGAAPSFVLDAVRDLRRVSAHLAAVAHPVLEQHGALLPSRLLPQA
jgi:phosphate:Na+ symporter